MEDFNRLLEELKTRNTFSTVFEFMFWFLVEFLAVVGNGLTLKIIFSNPGLRTPSNYLIASLAVADFALNISSNPLLFGVMIRSKWPYDKTTCEYQGVAALTFACASVLNITLMAINRYVRIVQSSKYNIYFDKTRTAAYIIGVWILSIIGSLSYLFFGNSYIFNPGKFFCYLNIDDYIYLAVIVTFYIFLPCNIIIFCYYKVYKVIQNHNQTMVKWGRSSQNLSTQEIKVTKTLFLIVVMFMVCWFPVFVMDIIDAIRLRWSLPRQAYVAYSFLAGASSCVNPILYGIMNPTFREEYLKVLCWRCRGREVHVLPFNENKGLRSQAKRLEKLAIEADNKQESKQTVTTSF